MDLSLKRLVSLLAAAALLGLNLPAGDAVAVQRPDPDCFSCLVVADDGTVLFSRRAHTVLPNASTTKMVTALVARAEGLSLDEELSVSSSAAAVPPGRLTLTAGERLTVREMLASLLMASSNQAAVALAERVAGSHGRFVELMNEMADSIGASDGAFVNAHGLDAPGHGASAHDLAAIARALLDDPVLADLVASERLTLETSTRVIELTNTNELLGSYPGLIGVKTGFTSAAGNVLVSAADRRTRRVIAVVMRAEDPFVSSRSLLDFGFEKMARGILLAEMSPMTDVVFDPAGPLSTVTARTVRGISDPDRVVVRFRPAPDLALPVEIGSRVGTAVVFDPLGGRVGSSPVVAATEVEGHGFGSAAARILAGVISGAAGLLPGDGR